MTNYQQLKIKRLIKDSDSKIINSMEQLTRLCEALELPTSTSMPTMLEHVLTSPISHVQDRDNAIAIYSNFVKHRTRLNLIKELQLDE